MILDNLTPEEIAGVRERWEKHTIPEPNSGCVLWLAAYHDAGYGMMGIKKSVQRAHRVAWELFVGPIPDGMNVLHRCDNRACSNVRHLFLGTNDDNMKDMARKKRGRGSRDTHCKNGHEFTPENTVRWTGGGRKCKTCTNQRNREKYGTPEGREQKTRYHKEHREELKEKARLRYQAKKKADPEGVRRGYHEYYVAHKEEHAAYQKRLREENPELHRERRRAYYQRNKARIGPKQAEYKRRKRAEARAKAA